MCLHFLELKETLVVKRERERAGGRATESEKVCHGIRLSQLNLCIVIVIVIPFFFVAFQDLFYLFSAAKSRKRVRLVIINWKETEILIKNYRSNGIVVHACVRVFVCVCAKEKQRAKEENVCPFGKSEMQWKRINNVAKLSFVGRWFFLSSMDMNQLIFIYIWNWMLCHRMETNRRQRTGAVGKYKIELRIQSKLLQNREIITIKCANERQMKITFFHVNSNNKSKPRRVIVQV